MKETRSALLDEVEAALIDILNGSSVWHEIQGNTGLSESRCKEIETLFREVMKRYNDRHGIGKPLAARMNAAAEKVEEVK